MWRVVVALAGAAGCSQILGISDLHTVDAPSRHVTLSGSVKSNDGNIVVGASVMLINAATLAPLASDMSTASGGYSLTVTDPPVDIYVHTSAASYEDSRQYLAAPLVADVNVTMFVFLPMTIATFATQGAVTQATSSGFVFVEARDPAGDPMAEVMVGVQGSTVRYFGPSGGVDPAMQVTDASGFALGFNAPVGNIAVTATATSAQVMRRVDVVGGSATIVPIIVQP